MTYVGSLRASVLVLVVGSTMGACDGAPASLGLDQPVRVADAQFRPGPMPGAPPGSDQPADGPAVTALNLNNFVVYNGAAHKRLAGRAQRSAVAVGVTMPGFSDDYWVLPTRGVDVNDPDEVTYLSTLSFHPDLEPGLHPLRLVAIDAEGRAGRQRDWEICLLPPYPDNRNACDAANEPPEVVVTLSWDRDADVDLEIVTPSGRRVTPQKPRVDPDDDESPRIDRDSLARCRPDGLRRESIAFQERPSGTWRFYVRLYDACENAGVRWDLSILEAEGSEGDRALAPLRERTGRLVAPFDAVGAEGPGLFVTELTF
jgi:hypothetical protein